MEKDIERISKNPDTDIVIRIDDYAGKRGVTIREFVKGERYTGFTKAGTRIPADKFKLFKAAINSINEEELLELVGEQTNFQQISKSSSDVKDPSMRKEATSKFTDVKEEVF